MTKGNGDDDLSAILDGTEIPFAYKMSYIANFYREPSFRLIEAKLDLKRSEIVLLIFLAFRQGITAQDMCDLTGHLKANVSRAVLALEKKGMIVRRADRTDSRRQLLFLTDAGQAAYRRFMPLLKARETAMLAGLSARERHQFMRLLTKLAAHVPDWTGENDELKRSEL